MLRTVISRVRDEYGAVEKALKNTLTICTVLVTPVVVVLSCCWRQTLSPSAEVLFQLSLQPASDMVCDVYTRKNLYAEGVVRWSRTCARRVLSARRRN